MATSVFQITGANATALQTYASTIEVYANAASASAAAAKISEDNSAGSLASIGTNATLAADAAASAASTLTASTNHQADAQKLAVNPHNSSFSLSSTNGGTSGLYSALHYSTLATASQSAASTSETNAGSSETAAAASATTAGHYAVKVDDVVPTTSDHSAKAWATNTIVDTSGGGSAKSWATKADSTTVDGLDYSSKSYAIGGSLTVGSAKNWALGGGSGFTTANAVAGGVYSAKYYAEAAQSAASNAQGSLTSFQAVYLGSGSSDPTSGHTSGDIFFNSTVNKLKYYDGSSWIPIEAAASNSASQGFAIAMSAAL